MAANSYSTLSEQRLLTEHELAHVLSRSLGSIRRDRLFLRGVPFVRIGSSVRYHPKAVQQFIANLPTFGNGTGDKVPKGGAQ